MQGTESTQNGVIRVRVSDLLFALQKRWMVIVALSLVGLTFGLILSAMTVVRSSYQSYNINGSFAITSKNTNGQYVGGYNAPNVNAPRSETPSPSRSTTVRRSWRCA